MIVKLFSGVLSDYLGRRKGLAVLGYGLSTLTKPLFAIASSIGLVFTARMLDRLGKGVRGAPRDALVADLTPEHLRGAAFGLRQSMDSAGALIGPLLATGLMLLWANQIRAVFWVAVIPGAIAVVLLFCGIQEPGCQGGGKLARPIQFTHLKHLERRYWWIVGIGAVITLARFSEAFLVLRARQNHFPLAFVPLVMVAMNLFYSLTAYPFGKLSDRLGHRLLLVTGLIVLIVANLFLAIDDLWATTLSGVALWGVHMGMTQGLLASMVANAAPPALRGTAFGIFNLVSGLAMLLASILAGLLWEWLGAAYTFYAGALFCTLAIAGLAASSR
ncbi:MFS transporter [Desulfosarcina cetonica]|uniref:MFS transporter n=1 Tax=Desulfosarcina cetonica TaxID=90730 RepID=UPI000A9CFBDE|nr:MFS transporter [Desulfosarcina cetonica]